MPRLLLAFFLLLGCAGMSRAAPKVRIGVENNSPPLSFVNAQRQPDGFASELLHEMSRAGGFEIEIVPDYWNLILGEFQAGRIDALANVAITDERRETMDFSIAHASMHAIAYTRPGTPAVRHTSQFAGKTMATLAGSFSHTNAVKHGGWGARIELFTSWKEMLEAVKTGRCDFALLLRSLTTEQPDELGLQREFVEDVIHEFHLAVHRGDRANLERLNEALAIVRHNGAFDRIYAKWIGPIEPRAIRLADLRPYVLPGALVVVLVAALFWWQRQVNHRLARQASALRESEHHYHSLFSNMLNGFASCRMIWEKEQPVDFVYLEVNAAFENLTGLRGAAGLRATEVMPGIDKSDPGLLEICGRVAATGKPERFERFLEVLQMWVSVAAYCPQPGHFVAIFEVITERKQAEERLRESVREKEALLKEVHHRVKNNLQVITSLLRLESAKHDDAGTRNVLQEMQSRIRSMALLHETLYRSGNFAAVNLSVYLKHLATQLMRAHNPRPGSIQLQQELAPALLEIDRAIPCGLILNELLTNSLKHAFPEGRSGEIRVALQIVDDGERIQLEVGDTGAGLPAPTTDAVPRSLGLQLVRDLTRQLRGTLETSPPGQTTCFRLTFPVVHPEASDGTKTNPAPGATDDRTS